MNHGTIALIAWGMGEGFTDLTPDEFRAIRAKINDELRPHRMGLKSAGAGRTQIVARRRSRHRGNRHERKVLAKGTLQETCRQILPVLESSYPRGLP